MQLMKSVGWLLWKLCPGLKLTIHEKYSFSLFYIVFRLWYNIINAFRTKDLKIWGHAWDEQKNEICNSSIGSSHLAIWEASERIRDGCSPEQDWIEPYISANKASARNWRTRHCLRDVTWKRKTNTQSKACLKTFLSLKVVIFRSFLQR